LVQGDPGGDQVADGPTAAADASGGQDPSLTPARAHLHRFGLLYVLAAFWLIATVVLPSHALDVRAAVSGSDGAAADDAAIAPGLEPGVVPGGVTGTPSGAAPGATAPGVIGTPGAPAPVGTSKGGVECGPGVRQVPGSSYAAPCVPAFTGDNGGSTHRGVTATTIRIVRRTYAESANSQAIDAVVAQAGGADHSVTRSIRERFIAEFEKRYELYGRRIEWVDYQSRFGNDTAETQGRGREGACLDAEVVANELNAFAVTGEKAALSKPFTECAAERGVVVLNGASYASERFYRDRHPYVWALIMDCERINYQVVEYLGKRLNGRPARWAGDPQMAGRTRKFGVYTPVGDGKDDTCAEIQQAEMAKYGGADLSVYRYVLDVSRFPDEAARGVIQFKRDGITTLVMACDPISMIFLTQSATTQNWRPEWFLIGIILTDVDNAARLYDQSQVDGHLFGMSQLGPTPKILGPTSEPGKLYQAITKSTIPAGTSGQYFETTHIYNLLQAAGPNLTPDAIGVGAYTLPPGGGPDYAAGYWSFLDGSDGTPGAHDHTLVDDSREVYWRSDVRSTADGKAGAYIETYGGRRFRNGEWPTEEPPVYPERG
jgi:hypothetical protein